MPVTDLARFSNTAFDRGASRFKETLWVLVRCLFFAPSLPMPGALRVFWLRWFGAKIGKGVVIRSRVNILFPWKLTIGDHVWLGEECWLLNLERITIGNNVCISQRAFLCTGSHNYKLSTFDLITKPIAVEAGVWIGASAWVGPGVTIGSHAVLAAGSVTTKDLEPGGIYRGNPAVLLKQRAISAKV
jgi:putative colanic acid biosynthesis acetyltransferase WcaF